MKPPIAKGKVRFAQADNDLSKPTPGEYAAYTAKEFLQALEAVADNIPVPGLNTAVKLATKLIEVCDVSSLHVRDVQFHLFLGESCNIRARGGAQEAYQNTRNSLGGRIERKKEGRNSGKAEGRH